VSDASAARARLLDAMHRPASNREIATVLGIPIALSLASALRRQLHAPESVVFSNPVVVLSLLIQVAIAACLLPYLYRRHWKPLEIAGVPDVRDVARGIGLWLGVIGFFYMTMIVVYLAAPDLVLSLRSHPPFTGSLAAPVIVAAAILDPVFEEFLLLGYLVPALGNRFGIKSAAAASVLLRVAVHTYQGRLAFMAILPVAVILTFYYVRTGRLWPVIVAHIVQDALALTIAFGAT
jgi:membrane protease YdiL (CAAX protease family)